MNAVAPRLSATFSAAAAVCQVAEKNALQSLRPIGINGAQGSGKSTLSLLASIEIGDLETVIDSRLKQEEGLSASVGLPTMDRAAIIRFVQYFERYTRALWATMPGRVDMLFRRTRDFGFTFVEERP